MHRILAVAGFTENFCSIGMSYEPIQIKTANPHLSTSSNRTLAATAELIEQRPFARGCGASGRIIKKCKQRPGSAIAIANFYSQRALPGSGGHNLGGNYLAYQLRFAQ